MARRIIIGRHPTFGVSGAFLSRPGDDVVNPSGALLLDSRYQNVAVHAEGRFRMGRTTGNGYSTWWATVHFPDLGYRPLFYGSMTYANPHNANKVPVDSNYYPTSSCANRDTTLGEVDFSFGVWLENNATIKAKAYAASGPRNADFDFYYIILKRAT